MKIIFIKNSLDNKSKTKIDPEILAVLDPRLITGSMNMGGANNQLDLNKQRRKSQISFGGSIGSFNK